MKLPPKRGSCLVFLLEWHQGVFHWESVTITLPRPF